jgi:CheY-like chemotaxis protein
VLIELAEKGILQPDIVISDFNMGSELNGVELLNSIRKMNPALKALIVTGNPMEVVSITNDFTIINKDCFTLDRIIKFANACTLEMKLL